jgi:hypothetical protein
MREGMLGLTGRGAGAQPTWANCQRRWSHVRCIVNYRGCRTRRPRATQTLAEGAGRGVRGLALPQSVTVMLSLGPADYRDVAFCEARGERRSGSARIIMLCTRTEAVCGSTHPRCIDRLSFAVPTVQIQQFTACRSHNLARHHVRADPNKKPATDAEPGAPKRSIAHQSADARWPTVELCGQLWRSAKHTEARPPGSRAPGGRD